MVLEPDDAPLFHADILRVFELTESVKPVAEVLLQVHRWRRVVYRSGVADVAPLVWKGSDSDVGVFQAESDARTVEGFVDLPTRGVIQAEASAPVPVVLPFLC